MLISGLLGLMIKAGQTQLNSSCVKASPPTLATAAFRESLPVFQSGAHVSACAILVTICSLALLSRSIAELRTRFGAIPRVTRSIELKLAGPSRVILPSQGCWEQSLEKLLFCSCVAPTNWPLRASALEVLTGECLIQLGFTDEAEARLSDHAYCVRSSGSASYVHLANSYLMIANAKAAKPDWQHSQFETDNPLYWVNLIYKTFGLTTLELVDSGLPLHFSNISGSKARDLTTICNHPETVSVIVPAHNAEGTIRCTISSLLYQSWANVEIVVVDDASSDSTYCHRVRNGLG